MKHPQWEEHQYRKKHVVSGDWCKAGGLENFAKINRLTDHPNYCYPHVVDHTISDTCTNCIFCGKEIII